MSEAVRVVGVDECIDTVPQRCVLCAAVHFAHSQPHSIDSANVDGARGDTLLPEMMIKCSPEF